MDAIFLMIMLIILLKLRINCGLVTTHLFFVNPIYQIDSKYLPKYMNISNEDT